MDNKNMKKSNGIDKYAKAKKKHRVRLAKKQVIVKFKEGTKDDVKKISRKKFGITDKDDYEICCADKNLELWGINNIEDLSVEDAVSELRRDGGVPEAEGGDYHYTFAFLKAKKYKSANELLSFEKNITGGNKRTVNIAVLDTGIDPRYFGDKKFLYDTSKLKIGNCNGPSGWSFTGNGSANVLDDHGHGTYVTKIITSYLDKKNIDYRILPLKVLNSRGKGSYWNILCAISYLRRLRTEGVSIDLVNLSLGGLAVPTFFNENDFMKQEIQKMEESTLFVTSAGNGGFDTDYGQYRHFPSSYSADNIFAVGGHRRSKSGDIKMHKESNFGKDSIDIAAKFSNYSISNDEFSVSKLKGTSYAAAHVTALSAEHCAKNKYKNPLEIKESILHSAQPPQSFLDGKIKDKKAILPTIEETQDDTGNELKSMP